MTRKSLARLVLALALAGCSGSIEGGGASGPGGPPTGGGNRPGGPGQPGTGPGTPGTGGGSNPGTNPGGNPGTNPGTNPGGGGTPGACALPPARIWALTPDQLARTLTAVLPTANLSLDSLAGAIAAGEGFSNTASRLNMTEPYVGQLLELAYQLGSAAAADPAKLAPCLAQATVTDACVSDFVKGFAGRAYRRDLTGEESQGLVDQYKRARTGGDATSAIRQLIMAVLTSPNFLFRTELGEAGGGATVALTPFERASSLSYFLTDGPPDAELLAAARSGALARKDEIEKQTRRLVGKGYQGGGLERMLRELYQTAAPRTTDKDEMVFPEWKTELADDLAREGEAFMQQVLFGEDAKLPTLLAADWTMINPALATYYGLPAPGGTTFTKVKHKAGERAGFFTQAGRMASLAVNDDTDAVARGRFIREVLLCQHLPPPPDNLSIVPPPPDGKNTQRERLAKHSADPTCASCHKLMDPLGLAFESYDSIGRYRTMDVGKPLELAGTLTGAEPEGASFKNGTELIQLLAKSPTVSACFVQTAFRYAHGRAAEAGDACTIDRLAAQFATSGGDIKDLAVAITTDDSFTSRAAR
jgi:hypothetical protein